MGGVEPPSELYEGSALPLSYTGQPFKKYILFLTLTQTKTAILMAVFVVPYVAGAGIAPAS